MLYSLVVSSLVLASVSFGAAPQLALFENGDANIDQCEEQSILGELTLSENSENSWIKPCIWGDLISAGSVFRLRWYHSGDELFDLMTLMTYDGEQDLNTLKQGNQKVSNVWADIIPSSAGSIAEIVTVKLFSVSNLGESDEIETELDSHTLVIVRLSQSAGQGDDGFVVLTSEPTRWKDCRSSNEDLADVGLAVAAGETLYVCVLFYNPICPNEDISDGNTQFSISVRGNESNGLSSILSTSFDGPTDNPSYYECGSNGNSAQTYRFSKIENYGSIESIEVSAEMISYGEGVAVGGTKDIPLV